MKPFHRLKLLPLSSIDSLLTSESLGLPRDFHHFIKNRRPQNYRKLTFVFDRVVEGRVRNIVFPKLAENNMRMKI